MSLFEISFGKPWLLTDGGFSRLMEDKEKASNLKPGATDIEIMVANPRAESQMDDNGIAHIHIAGVIGHRLNWVEKSLGNTDVCDVRRELDAAIEAGANGIFMQIDSPGGTVTGTVELADAIAEISIPVYAFGDSCIASAAYWIACGARQIWTTPSAELGSIGIILPWIDKGGAWNQAGLKWEPITNTEAIYKVSGPVPSLTADQVASLQEQAQRLFDLFQGFINQQRPQVEAEVMRGQCFLGLDAPSYGLSDYVGTREEAYTALCLEARVYPYDIPIDQSLPITFPIMMPESGEKSSQG